MALESQGLTNSVNGRIAIGRLVVEDLAMVVVLVLLPRMAALAALGGGSLGPQFWTTLGRTLAPVAVFIVLMLVAAACSRGCFGRWRALARASCSRCAWWRRPSASHGVRPSCST
jgi:predicted Kef-type K+ transport protein